MDQLAIRYADPSFLLDGYISTGRLCEFLDEFAALKVEDDKWEYFLHKVWDKSYREFCDSLSTIQKADEEITPEEAAAIMKTTMEIMGNFNPDEDSDERKVG